MITCAGLSKALAIPWGYYGCDLRSRFNWDLGNNSQDILTQESNSHPGFLARVFYFSTLLTTLVRSLVSLKWIKRSRVLLSLKQKDFLSQTGHGEILMTRICLWPTAEEGKQEDRQGYRREEDAADPRYLQNTKPGFSKRAHAGNKLSAWILMIWIESPLNYRELYNFLQIKLISGKVNYIFSDEV